MLKPAAIKDTDSRSCGRCGNTIRMRDNSNLVLCTAILGVVDADFDDVCEHYFDRQEALSPPYPELD